MLVQIQLQGLLRWLLNLESLQRVPGIYLRPFQRMLEVSDVFRLSVLEAPPGIFHYSVVLQFVVLIRLSADQSALLTYLIALQNLWRWQSFASL